MDATSSSSVYGLGPALCEDDIHFPASKLPTVRMIIRAMKYLGTQNVNTTRYHCAKILCKQIKDIYGRAGIPFCATPMLKQTGNIDKIICGKILKVVDDYKRFRKKPLNRRRNKDLEEYSKVLDKTCVLWSKSALEDIESEEDKRFLLSVMQDVQSPVGALKKKSVKKVRRKKVRISKELKRKHEIKIENDENESTTFEYDLKEENENESITFEYNLKEENENESVTFEYDVKVEKDENKCITFDDIIKEDDANATECSSNTEEGNAISNRKHQRPVKTGTSIFIPHDILKDPDLQQHCERLGLSLAQTASLTRKIVEKCGGDPNNLLIQ